MKIKIYTFIIMMLIFSNNSIVLADSFDASDLVITVKTNNAGSSNDKQFEIPTYTGESYNYSVDCDDNGVYEDASVTGNYTCNYPQSGDYTIVIHDNTTDHTGFSGINFNNSGDKDKILSVKQWGKSIITSMENAFYGCLNLSFEADDTPSFSDNGVSMKAAFKQTQNLNSTQSSWNSWDTKNITNMNEAFIDSNFNEDISSWDTSRVVDMKDMFNGDSVFNQDLSRWNTSNVVTMEGMFKGATSFNNGESAGSDSKKLSWNTSNVTNMKSMFEGDTSFNQKLLDDNGNPWDTSNVNDITNMFNGAVNFNQDLGGWNVSSISNADGMFSGVTLSTMNYNSLLSNWSTQSLQDNVTLDAGNSKYCAQNAHDALTNQPNNWIIYDGGLKTNCPSYEVSVTKVSDGNENSTNPSFMVSVSPTNTSGVAITGNINYSGTATNGVDYQMAANTFSIPNGYNSSAITINTINDAKIEGDETIIVKISNLSQGSISNDTTTLKIVDDDKYHISIEGVSNGEEPVINPRFEINVSPINNSSSPITGNITYSGTATNGVDYQMGTSTFSIPIGSDSTEITLHLMDDKITEGTESINVKISNLSTGVISNDFITLDLLDDDKGASLEEITHINVTEDHTPIYKFSSDKSGLISYKGDCSSPTTNAIIGLNTITFNYLSEGVHSNCVINIVDNEGNISQLHVSDFTIKNTTSTTTEGNKKTPIFRLYNTRTGTQLYTRGEADKNKILTKFRDFEFTDGAPAFYASLTEQPGLTPIYRLYNTRTGAQLYTRGEADKNKILTKFRDFEFTDGAPAFYASLTDDGTTPIFRLYNTRTGMQLYTRGEADKNKILNKFRDFEFTDDGPAFYASLTN